MPTFLTTPRMSPELRARVQASVRADLRQRTLFPERGRGRVYLRLALGVAAVGLSIFLVVTYRQSRHEVEEKRTAILANYHALAASLPRGIRWQDLPSRAGQARLQADGHYDLDELLQSPLLYLRGDAKDLGSAGSALDVARDASVDALASCLLTPPQNLRESTLLRAIGQAPPADRVSSFADALSALEFFESTFARDVRTATQMQELERLAGRLNREAFQRGLVALRARFLLVVIDQAKAAGVISDFDGEAPHDVVLRAIDLKTARVVWQEQRPVDPAWISAKSRLAYSRPLDSCRLAFELLHPAPAAADEPTTAAP
jgi:hypothetical protein